MEVCTLCRGRMAPIFNAMILGKYSVAYFRCHDCGSVFTEPPFWLEEAYARPIALSDTGILERNIRYAATIHDVVRRIFKAPPYLIDFGGGYGILVRLLRDKGIHAYWSDKYAENIFAKGFEADRCHRQMDVGVGLEVVEHLEKPKEWFDSVLPGLQLLVVSTELVPTRLPSSVDEWWYFLPETGQHLSFLSAEAMRRIARDHGRHYFQHEGLHFFWTQDDLPQLVNDWPAQSRRRLRDLERKIEKVIPDRRASFPSLTRYDHLQLRRAYSDGSERP